MLYEKRNLENIEKLADHTKAAALKWHEYLVQNGIDVLIYETIRDIETQRANVKKGASQTMKSYHLVGQALDFVPVVDRDRTDWNAYKRPEIQKAIAEAKRLGFEWGGDWKTFIDRPHLQFNYKGYGTDTFGESVAVSAPIQSSGGIIAQVKVKATNLNIRSGNGTQYPVIGKAEKGEIYNVTGNLNDWHEIIVNDHQKGWVFGNNGEYLELV